LGKTVAFFWKHFLHIDLICINLSYRAVYRLLEYSLEANTAAQNFKYPVLSAWRYKIQKPQKPLVFWALDKKSMGC
jgi:hypothetical protein